MRICVFHAGPDLEMTEMCIETAIYHNPDAEIVHLTCMNTPMADGAHSIKRLPWDGTRVGAIITRLDHLCQLEAGPAVLLDDDTIVQGSFDPVFDGNAQWDVGLTFRPKETRYNCGVMFHQEPAFWMALRERVPPDTKDFMIVERVIQQEIDTGKWTVKELDCREWNNYWVDGKTLPDAKVVHFKGGRKDWMKPHFNRGLWRKEKVAA